MIPPGWLAALTLAAFIGFTPPAARAQDFDPAAEAEAGDNPLLQSAAAELSSEESSESEAAAAAPASAVEKSLQTLASLYEFYRHPAHYADSRLPSLTREFPAELAPYLGSRQRGLYTIYRSLAVIDYSHAMRAPGACPGAAARRREILASPDRVFLDAKGTRTPWLERLLEDAGSDAAADEDMEASEGEQAGDEEFDAAEAAAYAASRSGRELSRVVSLSEAIGRTSDPEKLAALRCARANAYALLAAAERVDSIPRQASIEEDAADSQQDEQEEVATEGQEVGAVSSGRPGVLASALKHYGHVAPSVVFIRGGSRSGAVTVAAGSVLDASGTGRILTRARAVVDPATGKPYEQLFAHFMPPRLSNDLGRDLGRGIAAELVSADMGLDLAVLRLLERPERLQPLALADDSHVKAGDLVFAVGHPEQGGWWAMSYGTVIRRIDAAGGVPGKDVFMTRAGISRGGYGGPLIDSEGRQVGVVLPMLARDSAGRAFWSPAFAVRSNAVRRWLSHAAETPVAVEETLVADVAEDAEEGSSDEDVAGDEAASDADVAGDEEAFDEDAADGGEGGLVTVAQPYDLSGLITVNEDSEPAGYDAEDFDAESDADAEPAGDAEDDAAQEQDHEVVAVAQAPPHRPLSDIERVRKTAASAFDELEASGRRHAGSAYDDAADEAGDADALDEAAAQRVASAAPRPSAPAPRPAPAPRAAPAPAPRPVATPAPRPAIQPTVNRVAPVRPAAPPARVYVQAPAPPPQAPAQRPQAPAPRPQAPAVRPGPTARPVPYTPRPAPPRAAPSAGRLAPSMPRPSPAPRRIPASPRPVPVPPAVVRPPPRTVPVGPTYTQVPPPRTTAPVPPSKAPVPMPRLGGQMGKLEPFNWRKPAGHTPETLKVSGDKHFTDALKYRLPPPPPTPKAICAANCGRPAQKAPSTSTRAPATSRPSAPPTRAPARVAMMPVPVPGFRPIPSGPGLGAQPGQRPTTIPPRSRQAPPIKCPPGQMAVPIDSVVAPSSGGQGGDPKGSPPSGHGDGGTEDERRRERKRQPDRGSSPQLKIIQNSEAADDSDALEAASGSSGWKCMPVGSSKNDRPRHDGISKAEKPDSKHPGANGQVTRIGNADHLRKHGDWTDSELAEFVKKFIQGLKGMWRLDAYGRGGYVYLGQMRGRPIEGILRPDGTWVSLRPPP